MLAARGVVRLSSLVLALIVGTAFCPAGRIQGAEPASITVATWGGTRIQRDEVSLAKAFMDREPGIVVEVLTWPVNQYNEKMAVMAASNTLPDVIAAQADLSRGWMQQGFFRPIDHFMREVDMHDFLPGTWEGMKLGDHYYGVPGAGGAAGIAKTGITVFRRPFADAGLPLPVEGWQWTNDFMVAARRLTKDTDGDGEIDFYGYAAGARPEVLYASFVWSWGGEILSSDLRSLRLLESEALAGIQFALDLELQHRVGAPFTTYAQLGQFEGGRFAMVHWNTQGTMRALEEMPFDVQFVPLPAGPAGAIAIGSGTGHVWGITPSSQQPDAAWQYLKWRISREGQMLRPNWPNRLSLIRAPGYLNPNGPPYDLRPVFFSTVRQEPWFPGVENFNRVMQEALARVWSGELSPKQAFTSYRAVLEAALPGKSSLP